MALQDTIASVKSFAAQFQGVIDLASQLEPLADIDAAIEKAKKDQADQEAILNDWTIKANAMKAEHDRLRAEAETVLAKAQEQADALLTEAKAKISAQEAESRSITEEFVGAAHASSKAAKQEQAEAEAARDEARKEHDEIAAKLAELKASLRAFTGA